MKINGWNGVGGEAVEKRSRKEGRADFLMNIAPKNDNRSK